MIQPHAVNEITDGQRVDYLLRHILRMKHPKDGRDVAMTQKELARQLGMTPIGVQQAIYSTTPLKRMWWLAIAYICLQQGITFPYPDKLTLS